MSVPRRRNVSGTVKQAVFEMYGSKCAYCHTMPAVHIDHVIPYSYSRYHGIENLRPSCASCNLMASCMVFEGFDEKYEYLRKERAKKKKRRILTCRDCLLPYYSALCRNPITCPWCSEGTSGTRKSREQWRNLLQQAGYDFDAHMLMREHFARVYGTSIPRDHRIEKLIEIYAERGHFGEVGFLSEC